MQIFVLSRLLRVGSIGHFTRLAYYCSFRINELSRNGVLIAAAVRTPYASFPALEEEQLGCLLIDELVKRATVPRNEFKKLILCSSSTTLGSVKSMAENLDLKDVELHTFMAEKFSVSGIQMTLETLSNARNDCIILSDIRRHSSYTPAEQEKELGFCASEVMDIRMAPRQKLQQDKTTTPTLGAAALVLTNDVATERLDLRPLARLRGVLVENASPMEVFRLCAQEHIKVTDVDAWHLVTRHDELQRLQLFEELNIHKIFTHDVNKVTASHLITHLVHDLPNNSLGCLVIESGKNCYSMLLVEKLNISPLPTLPELSLYTKDPCPLCDELVHELEQKFPGAYKLNKIYIDQKKNVRFLRLFRYDIPVLFFNGQFLCMHKLNESALRERLAAFKGSKDLVKR